MRTPLESAHVLVPADDPVDPSEQLRVKEAEVGRGHATQVMNQECVLAAGEDDCEAP
jgi:hypothetical protein